MTKQIVPSICRTCSAFCPILVTVEDGRATKVVGDPEAKEFEGYTCPKGRILPEILSDPSRLLKCLARGSGGTFREIEPDDLVGEVAGKLRTIVEQYGPHAVAFYFGTGIAAHPFGLGMGAALMSALGSPMIFSAATIDKPAEKVAPALHGYWIAGGQTFESADTWMIVGGNPLIAKSNGIPANNPGRRLKDAVDRGMKLIVIDPRKTETARRAYVHLQSKPGEDPAILAALIHIIIGEELYDRAFVAANVSGLNELRDAVAGYTPQYVAERAGVPVGELLKAARTFAAAKRGCVECATGPSFSMHSNVTFYLALCLDTLCGRWAREGEIAPHPNVLLPPYTPKAQPLPPYPVFDDLRFNATGMRANASGLPTAGLADEILNGGDRSIRALLVMGGNPASAWPDQRKVEAALDSLDLLVCLDYKMSATARRAHYIVPPPLAFELPGITFTPELLKYAGIQRGLQMPWAQYVPAAVRPPEGSELLEEHQFFFRVARKMGLQLQLTRSFALGKFVESAVDRIPLDMDREPSLDELFELAARNARIPLSEIKKYPHGHRFELDVRVAPRDPDCTARLDLGAPMIMAELAEIRAEADGQADEQLPYRLVCRRTNGFMNSAGIDMPALHHGKMYNPLQLCSEDAAVLDVADDDIVEIRSRCDAILGIVEIDDTLRPGVVSMSHGFGTWDVATTDPRRGGSNVNLLIHLDEHDPVTGIPRMSAIPVSIAKL